MPNMDIQIVSTESGEPTAVIVGVTDRPWDVEDLVGAWEANERRAERQAA